MAFALRPDIADAVDDVHMRRALELALRGRGRTAPNPAVGAVVVRDGSVIGTGFHPEAGQPHAEIFALAAAGTSARGSTLYVTLEPCAHHGRTPPCAEAIAAAGILRVIVGLADPTAEAGGGAELLRDAGIEVDFWPDADPFERLVEGWLTRVRTGRPFLRVKAALSLDGRPSFEDGRRASITGPSGAEYTRSIRAIHDAVLVGAATAIADDPALTVREADGILAEHQPLRVILVRDHVPGADSQVFTDHAAPTLLLAADTITDGRLSAIPEHVVVERFPAAGGIGAALDALGRRGLNDVLCEAGPRLLTALWRDGLIGEFVTVTAGGMAGPSAPALFLGAPDREGDDLVHAATPRFATLAGDLAVVMWRPAGSP